MEQFIQNYHVYHKSAIYEFHLGDGGLGDHIKFFMMALESCMKQGKRLYYKKMNIEIEKYIRLRHDMMYITDDAIKQLEHVEIVTPYMFYSSLHDNYPVDINQVFYFADEIKINRALLFPQDITNYLAIHLRLGDKYLETDKAYVLCKEDTRPFSEDAIHQFIETHKSEPIFFCCDNYQYKVTLKEKYHNIIITNCEIGHTSLSNTTSKHVLDGITEFYLLTNARAIFAASPSGFSVTASKFNNIPLLK